VDTTPATELPLLIGDLEAAKAAAWARLTALDLDRHAGEPRTEARNLAADEAAKRLGMSRDWLYKNASRLPFAIRIGRRVVFDATALERWNRSRTER